MWTIARYQPTAFFSLKPNMATSSGGKTLIVPTPFAVKSALLDVAIRTLGAEHGQALFSDIRGLHIAIQLPRQIVVNNTFARVLRMKQIKTKASEKQAAIAEAMANRSWPYQRTIAFREYVQFGGPLALAFRDMADKLVNLLTQVNYLGKRGGFIQLLEEPEPVDRLPEGFTVLTEGTNGAFPLGTLQMVDDWGQKMTFDRINTYSDARITPGKHRIFHHVVLPHRPIRSSRGFTLYEWE